MAWRPLETVGEFLIIHIYSWQAFFAFLACYGMSVVLQWQIQAYFWDHPERAIEWREKVYARGWWRYVDWRLFMLWATGYDEVAADDHAADNHAADDNAADNHAADDNAADNHAADDNAADSDSSKSTATYGGDTSIADSVGNTVLVGCVPPSPPPVSPPPLPVSPPPHTIYDADDGDGGYIGMPFPKNTGLLHRRGLATIREV